MASFNRKVEAMSMAITLLQDLVTNETELEMEHWLIPAANPDVSIRRQEAIQRLMKIVNERILKTQTMNTILHNI